MKREQIRISGRETVVLIVLLQMRGSVRDHGIIHRGDSRHRSSMASMTGTGITSVVYRTGIISAISTISMAGAVRETIRTTGLTGTTGKICKIGPYSPE